MIYPPSQKPPIWSIDPGVIAYNCQRAGMPHPVGAWPFWEGGGNLARDYSGHGNHGVLTNGPAWVHDGIYFDGGTNHIDTSYILPDIITVSTRIRADTTNNIESICSASNNLQLFFWDNKFNLYGPSSGLDLVGATTIIVGEWYHVAYNFENNNSNAELFVNGMSDGTELSFNPATLGALIIGSSDFNGTIADFLIFNTTLSVSQVKFLSDNPYFMYQIPEELYGYTAAAPPVGNPFWYYNMLKRRN